jgi:hypothetical protein
VGDPDVHGHVHADADGITNAPHPGPSRRWTGQRERREEEREEGVFA